MGCRSLDRRFCRFCVIILGQAILPNVVSHLCRLQRQQHLEPSKQEVLAIQKLVAVS
jgi:hypothetical protein